MPDDAGSSDHPHGGFGSTGVDAVTVVVADEQSEVPLEPTRWSQLARQVLVAEGCRGELTLTFVDADEITALNVEHMGHDGPTDVLSFPLDAESDSPPERGPVLLGDVVICPSVAAANASSRCASLDDELALLVVHGVLHVLGHDHAEPHEAAVMRARERALLEAHHWHGPPPAAFRQEQS